jgi:S-adenosylmethionine:tRNA-ribosyltransferase-isomerase (queuine synthetase)
MARIPVLDYEKTRMLCSEDSNSEYVKNNDSKITGFVKHKILPVVFATRIIRARVML